jgi:hypothetical protein
VEQWRRAKKVKQSFVPREAGIVESITVEKLAPDKRYYFGIKFTDHNNDMSELSNITVAYTTDTIPPQPIADLSATNTTEDSVTVSWTVVEDDQNHDQPALYELRYGLEPINEANWEMATVVDTTLQPSELGSQMDYTVTGLTENTRYYFNLRAIDGGGNISPLSNATAARTVDVTPPHAIADLQAMFPTVQSVMLSWTCPADVAGTRTRSISDSEVLESGLPDEDTLIAAYDIRYLEMSFDGKILDEQAWESAEKVLVPPQPLTPGTIEEFVVRNLNPAKTYFFAIKALDQSGNVSAISNIALEATLPAEFASSIQRRAISSPDALNWEIIQGQDIGEIRQDAEAVFTIKPKTTRPVMLAPVITAMFPRTYEELAIRQGELTFEVKGKQQFMVCAQVVTVEEEPYYLCYTPSEYRMPLHRDNSQAPAIRSRKRIENYLFYTLDPAILDNDWHTVQRNLAQDLFDGTGLVYHDAIRFSVRGADLSFRNMAMRGTVLTSLTDFEDGINPLENGWKLHFGAGTVQLTKDPAFAATEGQTMGSPAERVVVSSSEGVMQQDNLFLYAKSQNARGLVLTYPRDGIVKLSDKPIFLANVKPGDDFKLILKVQTKDQQEYYLAYLPEGSIQTVSASGNYIYLPLPSTIDRTLSGSDWMLIRANVAEDLRQNQLEYDHTSWISFHGKELSIDNVGFSTDILETELN